ncbi:uncharacterized protein LOC105633534 [Jatropha curcas]|uniref:uncharacterized protein LOC105633534 n=1 Tax=Jatropha curcas TaxID=180498 RepID=UPI0005FB243A|nr:uncharacterized protein LOC105633534 [Jatropha curcas]
MKTEILFLASLFLVICCKTLCHPEHNPHTRAKQLKNVYESMIESKKKNNPSIHESRHEVDAKSFQKAAKGVYGGGDTLRPRSVPKKSGASSLLLKSSTLLCSTLRHVTVGFIVFVALF